jgi:transcriptional regulator with XRE-family HTH domain
MLGDRLFELRRSRRLLQKQVAFSSGIDPSYLAGLERGHRNPPKASVLNRILVALDASESERAEVERAATIVKVLRTMQDDDAGIPGARTLARLALALPELSENELEALETLIDGICRRKMQGQEE